MLKARRREQVFWLEGRVGRGGARLRLSLGTRDQKAAIMRVNEIERGLTEGSGSGYWHELRRILPGGTFGKLAEIVGWSEQPTAEPAAWGELAEKFKAEAKRRIALGKLRESTWTRYRQTVELFGGFLGMHGISQLEKINRGLVEDFKAWRLEESKKMKQSRNGAGVVLDAAVLHRVFAYAVECEMIARNPVRLEGRPGDNPEGGAEPFKPVDMARLREHAGDDLLAFLLLRHTGFRGSDAVGLRWEEIDWEAREINRLTQKRSKRVVLPIHTELLFALESEREKRNAKPEDRVLLNPTTGKTLTRPVLYNRILALGRRAGVPHAHPHRFRDFFAVDLLAKGGSPYDVAKLLGDTVETVEKHYAPFVPELRERARRIMEKGEGLEKVVGTFWAHSAEKTSQVQ